MLFYQTRSHAIVLNDTLPAVCIEKVVCMKTKDELYQKVRLTPRVPRVVLKSNSRISYDQPSGSESPWETGSNTVDYRILGVPLLAVEQQDTHRKDKVKKLIEKFENTRTKNPSFRTSSRRRINEFGKESQDLIADMNNTEIFELCETD